MIRELGWRATFRSYGILFLVITLIGAWLLRGPALGYYPRGFDAAAQAKVSIGRSTRDIPTKEMLRSRNFYLLWLGGTLSSPDGTVMFRVAERLATAGRLHVDREGFFAALELHKVRLLVPQFRVFAAMAVAAQSGFATNHFRPELT